MTETESPTANTLFRPGKNCEGVAQADRLGLLVDGEEYFNAFTEAARNAQESILLLAWDFDSRTALCFPEDGEPITLGNFLNDLVRRRPNLHINILIWDYPMLYAIDRQFRPIYGLGWRPRRRVHIHYDDKIPMGACHHQKVAVIDDQVAFVGGLDLTSRRWDTCEHKSEDPRRMAAGKGYPPFHDTMIAVSGPAARSLGDLARSRWLIATGKTLPVPSGKPRQRPWRRRVDPATDRWPESVDVALENVEVAISRTMPDRDGHPPVREIEELYLDQIRTARESIYIENQYFTAHRLGDALEARLREDDGPDIVVVIRLLSHGWLEALSMEALRTSLIVRLRAADRFGRFKVYYPHVDGLPENQCIDVHSKLMIVDDETLRIGSANFANRSMGLDTECDLTIEANGDPTRKEVISAFRARLLVEHLGIEEEEYATAAARGGRLIETIESLMGKGTHGRTMRELEVVEDTSNSLGGIVKLADPEAVVPLDGLIEEFKPTTALLERSGGGWFRVVAIGLVILGMLALWRWTPLSAFANTENAVRLAEQVADEWWAIPVVLAGYTVAAFLMFPRPLLTLVAVMAFGPWLGFAVAMTGIVLATFATFLVGQRLDRQTVRRLAGRNLNRITDIVRRRGILAMTVLRLVPMAPFAVIGIVAGAVRVRLRDLLIGTALGTLPGTLITTVLGERLAEFLRHPLPENIGLFLILAVLALVAAWLVRKTMLRIQLPTRPA